MIHMTLSRVRTTVAALLWGVAVAICIATALKYPDHTYQQLLIVHWRAYVTAAAFAIGALLVAP